MTAPDPMLERLRTLAAGTRGSGGAAAPRDDVDHVDGVDHVDDVDDVDAVLDLVFAWFCACFRPSRAGGRSGVFHYEVGTPLGVRHRYVVVTGGTCTTSRTLDGTPDATIGVALDDLVALAVGAAKGTDAFVSGRLKISGDAFFAMNWIEWFGSRSRDSARPGGETA
ncbi:SCP2 sterol-binding domain-containing protein [Streptomyces albus]|uniref:SCP2 sterol-binding domain-containing protein n=1 Tax=Streptomyces albus TaxID=1888 RepID=UPI00340F4CA1